eukprot:848093-Prymnesium_polylepis.1
MPDFRHQLASCSSVWFKIGVMHKCVTRLTKMHSATLACVLELDSDDLRRWRMISIHGRFINTAASFARGRVPQQLTLPSSVKRRSSGRVSSSIRQYTIDLFC